MICLEEQEHSQAEKWDQKNQAFDENKIDLFLAHIRNEIIEERKRMIAERNRIINEVLHGYVAESEITSPLRYIKLPEHFTGKSFEICAMQAGVEVYGAERFALGNKPAEKSVRISVTTPHTIEDLTKGVYRLKELLVQ